MNGFTALDDLLREKLSKHFKNNHNESNNPFYITYEEVYSLLEDDLSDDNIENDLPGLELVANLFNLNEFEKKVLLMIAAPLIDTKYERIYAYLADDLNKKYTTISLLASLLTKTKAQRIEFLSSFIYNSSLFIFKLVHLLDPHDGTSYIQQPIVMEESVKDFLLGQYHLDAKLQNVCHFLLPETRERISEKAAVFIENMQEDTDNTNRFIVHLYGNSEQEKQTFALEIASSLQYGLLLINMQVALGLFESISDLIVLLYREAILSGTLLYFNKFDAFIEHNDRMVNESLLFDGLDRFSQFTFFDSRKEWKPITLPKTHLFLTFPFMTARYPESISLWEKYLKEINPVLAAKISPTLAQRFAFDEDEIAEVVRILMTNRFFGKKVDAKAVHAACRQRVLTGLETLAQPIRSSSQLDDIVLPNEQKNQLSTVISHYKNQFSVFEEWGFKKYFQSQGIGVLFTGSSGTGKTMAASILANTLDLDLYRIELSQVVSKYIGETEKNLSRIFESAEGSGVILFFDEADAIFGKRTEVKDAHDRYANIEVSYLLQRIEAYDGLVILASNFRKNIDEAFVRRMRFIIEFPFPDASMREHIWEKSFPKETPLDQKVRYAYLAKTFALSGANIRNSALSAAFFAAEQRSSIQMKHIAEGLKLELIKMGKSYKDSDFSVLLR